MKRPIALIAALALPACAATADRTAATPSDDAKLCKHEGLESFTGQKATAELGATLLARSGARTLRWGPPRSAMTMDFRPDRLTVSYDDAMVVTSVHCG
ncbi:MAG TPA: I78 family peptidase inhibitor [Sphingobium sp.]|nr:I78 family peptidase inhibitor [Sphingobium sp.]